MRTSKAAHRQLEAIRELGLDGVPEPLREVAELRVRHPALSLRELGAKCRPPASKAAVHRRLQRIVRLAEA